MDLIKERSPQEKLIIAKTLIESVLQELPCPKPETAQNVPNEDLISRKAVIEVLDRTQWLIPDAKNVLKDHVMILPSVQQEVNEYRKRGEWDMFELITSAWYGKQYYFKEDNGMAYSRKSHKTMTVHDAILEFIREIGDE